MVRSVRRFEARPVPAALVRAVLDAGRGCGSSKNGQPWQFVVLTEPATLRSLSVLGPHADFIARAPLAIVPVMEAGDLTLRAFDCGRVSQTMTLAADALGLGSCVAAIRPDENQRVAAAMLGVPSGYAVWVAIGLGYPASPVGRWPAHRKALRELVHVEAFGRGDADLALASTSATGAASDRGRGE